MKKHVSNNRMRVEPIAHEFQPSHSKIVASAELMGGAVTARHMQDWFGRGTICIARINRALDRAGWSRERNADGVIVWVKP